MEPSSAELLEQYRDGDERAAADLFTRYVERLTSMVRAQMTPSLRRRLDAEDAVQSAYRSFFVRARAGQFTLARSGDLWKLLVTITRNKMRRQIAHHQTHKRSVQRDRALGEFADVSGRPSPLEALAAADELAALMARLNPLQRQVLQLRLQEQRWEDIAKATGRSPRTVRRLLEDVQRIWTAMAGILSEPDAKREKASDDVRALSRVRSDDAISCIVTDPQMTLDYRDYVLEAHIGSGGMGKVYRARQTSTGQRVAVKMLRKVRWTQPGAVERFLEEARMVRSLRHPGIVEVFGVGRTPGGGPFIVMEFIEGDDLATIAARERPTAVQAADWIGEAATALHHAHQLGIVHCDLKPGNLLREHSGRIVVTDFGLAATRTESGYQQWGGTVAYMAPEQLDPAFGEVSPATDVFALGFVLFNLITGKLHFAETPIVEVIASWRDGSVISRDRLIGAGIAAGLVAVIERCLAVDPRERFANAAEFVDALRNRT